MVLYDVLLFLHISAAIIWIGSGFLLQVLGTRADRANDPAGMMTVLGYMGALGNTLFVPASAATFVLGLTMVIVGPWDFGDLWVILGLAGFAATFVTGAFVLKPTGDRLGAMVARDGLTPAALAEGRRLITISRIDYVVLFLVVAVMALKPTVEDVGVLAVMGLVLVGSAFLILGRIRTTRVEVGAA